MKTLTITLTKEDLQGDFLSIDDCPLARYFKRNFPDAKKIRVASAVEIDGVKMYGRLSSHLEGLLPYAEIEDAQLMNAESLTIELLKIQPA